MDSTNSLSEGVFVFNPKPKKNSKSHGKPRNEFACFKTEDWHRSFDSVWSNIQAKIDDEENRVLLDLMKRVNNFVHSAESNGSMIPTIIMLAGVNLSDHKQLFYNIDHYLLNKSESFTATLWASECTSVRYMVESLVNQVETTHDEAELELDWEDEDSDEDQHVSIKRSNKTLPHLVKWFNNIDAEKTDAPSKKKSKEEDKIQAPPRIIVIIPDFEAHNEKVLQDFLLILSGYVSKLPIVLMFGVASMMSAVHDSLPSHVISKLSFEFFKPPTSRDFLNSMINSIFLTPECPFMISGGVLRFLNDVFIYYDFSLRGFVRSLKYCVMDHFFASQVKQYCWPREDLQEVIDSITEEQIKALKKVPSFADWLEKYKRREGEPPLKKLKDFKDKIYDLLKELHESIKIFYVGLHCLHILVHDLPQAPLGSDFRELYIKAMQSRVAHSTQYEECMKTLKFASQQALLAKLKKIMDHLEEASKKVPKVKSYHQKVKKLHCQLESASLTESSAPKSPRKTPLKKREDLTRYVAEKKCMSDFESVRPEILKELTTEVIDKILIQLTRLPFHEELIYNSKTSVKQHMVGVPRGALHSALNDPHGYLECKCCKLKDGSEILKTMPDICIVYKHHLQWGTLINIYDWMQMFKSVVDPNSEDDEIRPEIQARFTQAVADLQFLGYIKHSNAKKDHVARLTIGG